MIVIIASECSGSARERSQRVLDGFFKRIGRRSWSGRITAEGLKRLRRQLAAVATRNTAICCHRIVSRRALEVAWFIGSRDRFDSRGYCVVNETSRDLVRSERLAGRFESVARPISRLAALFHDLGKNTTWFQHKLRMAKKSGPLSDYVRHEFISFIVATALFESFDTDFECLTVMADPDVAALCIERAYLQAFSDPDYYAFGLRAERLSVFTRVITRGKDTDARDIRYPDFSVRPLLSLLSDAILTHHKLTGARHDKTADRVVANVENLVPRRDKVEKPELEMLFELPKGLVPIWEDSEWIGRLSSVCAALVEPVSRGELIDRKAFSVIGRAALVLADHKASAYGNHAFPAGDTSPDINAVYANTNRADRPGELAERLAGHMVRVADDCDLAYDVIFSHASRFPGISHIELPTSISEPRADKDSPFRWQADASRVTRKALRHSHQSGFFGVLMADTGTGKTRASGIIMAAAADEASPHRLSVCSGLRTLTLQTGREYTQELRYPADAVSVVIGDEITAELYRHEIGEIDTGSETDELVGVDVLRMDSTANERALPHEVHDFVGESLSSATVGLLAAPILVSTIDTLMSVADGRRTGQIAKTLRVATSDLIIDEIDNFGAEDIVAIARLVFLHALFGRRVLISSATVYPEIAHSLFEAYLAGWNAHEAVTGSKHPVFSGWYSNRTESKCFEIDSVEKFRSNHRDFVAETLALPSAVRRRVRVSGPVRPDYTRAYFQAVTSEIPKLHGDNCVRDVRSGRRLSIGVVKWNNALPSILYATRLTEHGPIDGIEVFVVPYNGTLQAGPRHIVESNLNRMLRRKERGGTDPILNDPVIRDVLDNRSSATDVVVVVVTTSMEETGRDHDFDWAILEPGSQRSLIQIAGRVRRHRPGDYAAENIVLMQRAFREVRNGETGAIGKPVFAYPGCETPIPGSQLRLTLPDHEVSRCYDLIALAEGIDARDAISVELPSAFVANAERSLALAYLDGTVVPDRSGVCHFLSDEMAFVHGHSMSRRRFRRSSGQDHTFFYQDDKVGWGVYVAQAVQNCRNVDALELNETRLLLQIETEEKLRSSLASELWGEDTDTETWKSRSLLAVTRPLHSKNAHVGKYLYHRALGFIEFPDWLDRIGILDD